jgi:hypothetical protein
MTQTTIRLTKIPESTHNPLLYRWQIERPNRHDWGKTHSTEEGPEPVWGPTGFPERSDAVVSLVEHAFPFYAWPGAYTCYAVDTDQGDHLCIECARKEAAEKLADDDEAEVPWLVSVANDPATDSDITCANCNAVIDYAEPEEVATWLT